jgi:alanyl-tRNA synthetase
MGLERISAVVQGATANYDSDLFRPLVEVAEQKSGKKYAGRFGDPSKREAETEEDVAFRVIADHARATAFLVADGIYPENEGRGYVLRRVMRRSIRFGRKLGIEGEFLHAVCDKVVDIMGDVYPELVSARGIIDRVVRQEELRFGRTLSDGLRLLEGAIAGLRVGGKSVVPGRTVFELYDTHGFPVDLTQIIAEEQGFGIDEAGFRAAMDEQRERGRASWKGADADRAALYRALQDEGVRTEFVGYEWDQAESPVVALIKGGQRVTEAFDGDDVEIVAGTTPFYGESGGQVGDKGLIEGDAGLRFRVTDTRKTPDGITLHRGRVERGAVRLGQMVTLSIAGADRAPTRKNHSATHLLHWALRKVLGEHVKQRGSLVAPERLRFDFSHFGPLTPAEIEEIELLVNERIVANVPVATDVLPFQAAVAKGAMAFFEEKYGDTVRVVSMAESVELCGGTHVKATGDIGLLKIVSEQGISSGVRRVEAVTGMNAVRWLHDRERTMARASELLKTTPAQLDERVERFIDERRGLQQEIEALKSQLAAAMSRDQVQEAREFNGVKALALALEGTAAKDLRGMADSMRDRIRSGAVLLGSRADGKVALLVAVTPDLGDRLDAGRIVSELAPLVGGRGGGRKDMAQAGGSDPAGLDAAIQRFYAIIEQSAGKE